MNTNDAAYPMGEPGPDGEFIDEVDRAVARVTDADVEDRLRQFLAETGYIHPDDVDALPRAWFGTAPAYGDAPGLADGGPHGAEWLRFVQDVQRQAACAQAAAAAARHEADLQADRAILAEQTAAAALRRADELRAAADAYVDTVLDRAQSVLADARAEAEQIVTSARRQAEEITAAARSEALSECRTAPASGMYLVRTTHTPRWVAGTRGKPLPPAPTPADAVWVLHTVLSKAFPGQIDTVTPPSGSHRRSVTVRFPHDRDVDIAVALSGRCAGQKDAVADAAGEWLQWDGDRIRPAGLIRCPDVARPDAGIDVWQAPVSTDGSWRRAVYQLKCVTAAMSQPQDVALPVLVVAYTPHSGRRASAVLACGDAGTPGWHGTPVDLATDRLWVTDAGEGVDEAAAASCVGGSAQSVGPSQVS